MRVVKGIFVNPELPFLFKVKCEMTSFFFVKRDLGNRREPLFVIIIIREMRIECLIHREM